jgi:hypothetical protein
LLARRRARGRTRVRHEKDANEKCRRRDERAGLLHAGFPYLSEPSGQPMMLWELGGHLARLDSGTPLVATVNPDRPAAPRGDWRKKRGRQRERPRARSAAWASRLGWLAGV